MKFDYWLLAIVALVGIGGGLYLLHEARRLKRRQDTGTSKQKQSAGDRR